ncbi:MAG: ABC transporter permease [Chloroflexi bacterium]|nr:ABC transporter permease [Chloroflexota bacterium]
MATISVPRPVNQPSRASSTKKALGRFARSRPLGVIGGAVILILIVAAVFAPIISPYDPNDTAILAKLQAPSWEHPFGTDNLGRDILSRVIYGARQSLMISIAATLAGSLVGGLIGLCSAFSSTRVDMLIQRVADVMLAFPNLILLLALVAALGPSLPTIVVALAIGNVPRVNRLVRSAALTIKSTTYIEAAQAIGCGSPRIILWHLAPNCLAPWFIYTATLFGQVILAEATLSFLGLGVPPPNPSWGSDLTAAQRYFLQSPWMALWPGVAMSAIVFGANLLGDSLRDALDPKLRGR